jgi:hypothetical protein
MPYQEHEVFTPPDRDTTIWRYMDFIILVAQQEFKPGRYRW